MIIHGIRYADGELHLKCDPREGIRASYEVEAGKDYDIVLRKEKRSLNANAYAWQLIHKIAAELSKPPNAPVQPIEVYRRAIEETPDKDAEFICIKDTAAPAFIQSWENGHLGRMCEQFPSDTPGFTVIRIIYGSSDYDREQMSQLINVLVEDAKALGIETKNPEDVKSLLSQWKDKK
jgi:hypothetical protein